MNLNIRNYPLSVLKDLENLLRELKRIARENEAVIEIIKDSQDIFYAKDSFPNSNFSFRVHTPSSGSDGKAYYYLYKKPYTATKIEKYETTATSDTILSTFKDWINKIEEYNNVKLEDEEYYESQYAKEFYTDFKIVDEDAKTNTFNFSQQIFLHEYIESIKYYLENFDKSLSNEDKLELIEDANDIQKTITIDSKDTSIKKITKYWAKARKKSVSACKFMITEFVKEVIKEGAKFGFNFAKENLPQYIEQIKLLFN